jgi:type I restriction enzyme S subunit
MNLADKHTPAPERATTRTGGRPAIEGVIRGRYALSVGNPGDPVSDGWTWTALTSVARLESGHTPSRRHPEYWDGDIPWIGIRDATANHGRTLSDTAQHTNELGIANSSARVLPAGTVCLSRTASVGYVVVMGREMATSQDFVNWVCSPQLDHRFLKYILLAEHSTFLSFASGTTHQTIYFPEVKAFHVCLPSLAVQHRIADVLTALDDLIENNRRRVEVLEEMARAIYREWFVRFRYPGHQHAAFVDSALGPIPDGWAVATVAALASSERSAVTGGPFGSKLGRKDYVEAGVPVLRGANLRVGGGFDEDELVFVSDDKAEDLRSSLATRGDVIVTQRGTLGQIGLIPADSNFDRYVLSQSQMKITVDSAKTSAEFVYAQMREPETTERFIAQAMSSGVPHVNLTLLRNFELLVPSRELQVAFTDCTQPMDLEAWALRREAATLTAVRSLLLPALVTGQIDVSSLDLDSVLEGAAG